MWNTTVVMSGLVLLVLVATWNCWISYKKRICRTVGPSLAASLGPLAHRRNVASLSLFYIGIPLVGIDVHLNWLNWFHFFILEESLLLIQIDYMIFLSPFLDVTRMSMSTVSFLTQLGSGILCLAPIECFPLTYDLNGFKSRINRHLLTAGYF